MTGRQGYERATRSGNNSNQIPERSTDSVAKMAIYLAGLSRYPLLGLRPICVRMRTVRQTDTAEGCGDPLASLHVHRCTICSFRSFFRILRSTKGVES